jgi:hypothetical protein
VTPSNGTTNAMNLPAPIRGYFEANARLDARAMLVTFARDAVVRDEGRTHQGSDAIRTWIEQTSMGLQAIAVPQATWSEDDSHRVTAQVSGAFAGSPITLSFHFRLSGGRIAELGIT